MQLSTSSYYDYLKRSGSTKQEDEIEQQVISAFWRHKRRYGTRRLVSELSDAGYAVGRQRVRSILEDHGLRAIQPKAFVPRTTQTYPHLRRSANLLLDRQEVSACNKIWVGDITYLPLETGDWAYLETWLDLYSRYIVGWDIQEHMEEEVLLLHCK